MLLVDLLYVVYRLLEVGDPYLDFSSVSMQFLIDYRDSETKRVTEGPRMDGQTDGQTIL